MKKMTRSLAVGAVLLASAGAAQAATTYEINITGASAQFNFWTDQSKSFLKQTAAGAPGCTDAQIVQALTVDNKRGYSKCTNTAGDTYILRYTSNASYDGVTALQGTQDVDSCNGGAGTILRKYADDTVAPDGTGHIPNANVLCKPTVVGASDVNATSFSQISKGAKLGPLGIPGTDKGATTPSDNVYGPASASGQSTNAFTAIDASASSPSVLTNNASHLAVPFALYVNKGVTWKKCSAPTTNVGNFCMANSDCDTTAGAADGVCTSQTIDNLTRLQAVLLFSGTVTNWGQFGGYFDAKPVIACLRHAGSGTHATIDNAIMKATWGKSLSTTAKNNLTFVNQTTGLAGQTYNVAGLTSGTSTSQNYIWFNNGTGDVKNCLDGKIYDNTIATPAVQAGRADLGIVGYMDADQPSPTTNYVRVKFDGVDASRQAVRNGWYDYYTMQNIYYNTADTTNFTPVNSLITNATYGLIGFAANPANILDAVGISGVNESKFWATKGELRFTKSADNVYPVTKNGAVANAIPGAQQP